VPRAAASVHAKREGRAPGVSSSIAPLPEAPGAAPAMPPRPAAAPACAPRGVAGAWPFAAVPGASIDPRHDAAANAKSALWAKTTHTVRRMPVSCAARSGVSWNRPPFPRVSETSSSRDRPSRWSCSRVCLSAESPCGARGSWPQPCGCSRGTQAPVATRTRRQTSRPCRAPARAQEREQARVQARVQAQARAPAVLGARRPELRVEEQRARPQRVWPAAPLLQPAAAQRVAQAQAQAVLRAPSRRAAAARRPCRSSASS